MSEKVGLRTIEEPQGFQKSDNLGPNTTEIVSNATIVTMSDENSHDFSLK